MNKYLISFLAVIVLLIAPEVASANDNAWIKNCEDTSVDSGVLIDDTDAANAGKLTTVLKPGHWACADSADATHETVILDVGQCNHVDIFQFDDAIGDGTNSTVVGQVQLCPNAKDDNQSCDSFGLAEFSGNSYLEGLGARKIRIESNGTTDADVVRYEVHCIGSATIRPG